MPETRPYIPWDVITNFMKDAFMGYGVPERDAEICTDVLVESDRRGIESHGCNRFKPIYIDRFEQGILNPVTNIEVLRETPTTLVYDAHNGMGMVASHSMMEKLIKKAKTYGMAAGAIRNSSHYGIAGYWAMMATRENMIGFTGTNARPSIAPTFGVEPMLGTNPFTIAMPTDEPFPFVIDCATSITQRGEIEVLARQGKPTPEGRVIGRDGKFMTDSDEILAALLRGEASFMPVGGYKGYSYATGQLHEDAHRHCGGRFQKTAWVGALFHGFRSGSVYGNRCVQKDCRGYSARFACFEGCARARTHIHGGRNGISEVAGSKGQGRSGRRIGSARTRRRSR